MPIMYKGKQVVNVIINKVDAAGTLDIDRNGEFNVANYEKVNVDVEVSAEALPMQQKSVTPTELTQEVTPDVGYVLSKVTVGPIPNGYVKPTGTKIITSNGVHDVTSVSVVEVNIEGSTGGKLTVDENGIASFGGTARVVNGVLEV